MSSLLALPPELHLHILVHICCLASPPTLHSYLLAHPHLARIFSHHDHTLIPLLAASLPRNRYELALGYYNLRRLSARWGYDPSPVPTRQREGADLRNLVAPVDTYLLFPPVSVDELKAVIRVHIRAEAELREREERFVPGQKPEDIEPYFEWFDAEMKHDEEDESHEKNGPGRPPKMLVRAWVRGRVYSKGVFTDELDARLWHYSSEFRSCI